MTMSTAMPPSPARPRTASPPAPPTARAAQRPATPWQSVAAYLVLAVGSLAFLIPFYFVVNGSLKTDVEVQAGDFASPPGALTDVRWSNYPRAMEKIGLDGSSVLPRFPPLSNTIVITVLTIAGQILSCSMVGFGFARFRFRGRGPLFMLMLSTMMLPAQVTMIPVFILFRAAGLIDSFWPLVIPAWLASPFFVFMFRQFFAQIPEELIEAARIDGCGNWRIYWQLMLPLSGPVIAIVAIYTFLGAWNDFLGPLIYLNSPDNRTLALALNSFKGQYGNSDAHLLMAASVVCMLPCVILFFAAQRYFVESVATSGLKG